MHSRYFDPCFIVARDGPHRPWCRPGTIMQTQQLSGRFWKHFATVLGAPGSIGSPRVEALQPTMKVRSHSLKNSFKHMYILYKGMDQPPLAFT